VRASSEMCAVEPGRKTVRLTMLALGATTMRV
jgi:hypothetical protein